MNKAREYSTRKTTEFTYDSAETLHQALESIRPTLDDENRVFSLSHSFDAVRIGTVEKSKLNIRGELNPAYLQELRVFSTKGELHIWKIGNTFYNRLRRDTAEMSEGETQDLFYIYEEYHVMWGTKIEQYQDGWTLLTEEQRGINIWVPFQIRQDHEAILLPLYYKVRNYFDFDDNGLIQFKDARLCGFFYSKDQQFNQI